jgi:hypothetical protein
MEIENIWHRGLEIPEEIISKFIDILITDSALQGPQALNIPSYSFEIHCL